MLLFAKENGMAALATDIAALLEERDPLGRASGVDLNLRIEALRRHRTSGGKGKRFDNIEKIARSYRKLLDIREDNNATNPYHTGLLLAHAYPERIAKSQPGDGGVFQLANGKKAAVSTSDDLAHQHWLAIAHIDARGGTGKIFLASPVHATDLSYFSKPTSRITWNTQKGGIVATRDLRIGNVVLASENLLTPDENAVIHAIQKAIQAEGIQLLSFTDTVEQWQHRVLSLRHWRPDEEWPDVASTTLIQHPEDWLTPYLDKITKVDELKKLDLYSMLQHSLDFEKQQALEHLAPPGIRVPSGSVIKLRYSPIGEPPVLSVRLQEVFGLTETPRVNDGRNGVVMHLLSPGFKPVQVTADLNSFWQTTYFEVRKELKRRYPKHAWPEDPMHAPAVRGVAKKNR